MSAPNPASSTSTEEAKKNSTDLAASLQELRQLSNQVSHSSLMKALILK